MNTSEETGGTSCVLALTGGGTGGHSYTALAVFQNLREVCPWIHCYYIGSYRGIEAQLARDEKLEYHSIATGKLRRYFSWRNFTDFFRFFWGIGQAFWILRHKRTSCILSTGGFVSLPVVVAGYLLRVPILIHEQTSRVGLANRIGALCASHITVSFASSVAFFPKKKVTETGQPIRRELFCGNREHCYTRYGLDVRLPVVYVTGGSQGAQRINQNILSVLPGLLEHTNLIHQCGAYGDTLRQCLECRSRLSSEHQKRYVVQESFASSELKDIFASIRLLVGRSGALTVSETLALGIPALFIPLPHATQNEQYHNAEYAQSKGTALILAERDLKPDTLHTKITQLIQEPQYRTMVTACSSLKVQDSHSILTQIILSYTKQTLQKDS